MARSSPGVGRVVAILNFLAEHPDQAFTLTDIVRALKVSRATCHALLTGLVEAGYVYRTIDKSYVLGPGLVAIGRIADLHFSPLRVAQSEMRALADEFDAICSAVMREGNEVVIKERSASRSHLGWSVARGTRLPLRPPAGTVFTAWSPPAATDALIDETMPQASAEFREQMHAAVRFTREMGFQIVLQEAVDVQTLQFFFNPGESDPPIQVATEIDPDAEYSLASLIAPVFDKQRQIEFVLGLMGFAGRQKGSEIVRMGKRLREACDRVTEFLAGREP